MFKHSMKLLFVNNLLQRNNFISMTSMKFQIIRACTIDFINRWNLIKIQRLIIWTVILFHYIKADTVWVNLRKMCLCNVKNIFATDIEIERKRIQALPDDWRFIYCCGNFYFYFQRFNCRFTHPLLSLFQLRGYIFSTHCPAQCTPIPHCYISITWYIRISINQHVTNIWYFYTNKYTSAVTHSLLIQKYNFLMQIFCNNCIYCKYT